MTAGERDPRNAVAIDVHPTRRIGMLVDRRLVDFRQRGRRRIRSGTEANDRPGIAEHRTPDRAVGSRRHRIETGRVALVLRGIDGLVGLDVHRASRICQAGHGGQILASQEATSELGVAAQELGEFEFRGLRDPERIFQLVADDLPEEFPPLRNVRLREGGLSAVVADDSTLLREGLARLLEEAEIEVVGQARNADELMLKVRSYHPDVAIVDIRMPPTQTDEGIRAAREIRAKHPETGVLVLSQHVAHTYAVELLAESAQGLGYLLLHACRSRLVMTSIGRSCQNLNIPRQRDGATS